MVIELIPHTRSALSLGIRPGQQVLLDDLQRQQQLYGQHVEEILKKLVTLVSDAAGRHLSSKKWRSIQWNTPGPTPSDSMQKLIKEINNLHKILQQQLSAPQNQVCGVRLFFTCITSDARCLLSSLVLAAVCVWACCTVVV